MTIGPDNCCYVTYCLVTARHPFPPNISFVSTCRNSLLLVTAAVVGACHHGMATSAGTTTKAAGVPATPNASAAKPAASKPPAGVTLAVVTLGDSVLNNGSCGRCHSKGGVGATNGPVLAGKTRWDHGSGSYEDILKTVTTGVPKDQITDPSQS